ncbi:MAG: Eco57I restriction-modification methylase domain-containing protein, partial [Candidatus Bipolaricaulota bacterium]|nr:Eco57I restriction-modification methylase domain-containing protein [Candidatus Bipolaricaulota bacterium]
MSLEVAVRSVRDRDSLLALLRDELAWPLPADWSLEELTFEWSARELRVSESAAQRLKDGRVYQLRPLHEQQPWGIFFVIFDQPRISITTLRQTLRGLVPNRRQASSLPSWHHENLLFICTTRDYDRFTLAYFRGEKASRAVLTTFGWERGETALHTLCKYNLGNLRFPDDPSTTEAWLTQWRAAFDVQAVTEAFFRDYERVFATLQHQLYQQTNDKVWAHDYALQVLNRLMFLYFIQRKTTPDGRYWLGNDRRFIRGFWEAYRASGAKDSFFKRWLSVLFFEAFNNRFSPKPYLPQALNDALLLAPYLNGGLFTRNELDEKYSIELPDSIFEMLFDQFEGTTPGFFERYNFTISENTPLDQEVAVDPEMIGKVYESLVNITFEGLEEEDRRGRAGIFYTPRAEIDLMCRLSLVDWLANHLGEEPLLYDAVFAYDPEEKRRADEALSHQNLWPKLNALLRSCTVCDPACGSGSFLVGMLLVLDDLQARANAQLGVEETPYERRRRIIGEQLYGVDVMEWAVHVAELRLWLQLVVETDLKPAELKFRPLLPNLSFKVRPGDSLVQELGGISFALHRKHLDIPSALKGKLTRLKAEKLKFYRADPDDPSQYRSEQELKLAELQLFREILETKAHTLHNEIVILNRRIEHPSQLQALEGIEIEDRHLELRVHEWRAQRDELQGQLDRLHQALATLQNAHDVPFIWDIAFVEIFEGDKGGFDIVLGNPPYVRQEKIAPPLLREEDFSPEQWRKKKAEHKAKLQHSVCELWPRFFKSRKPDGKSDLYIYFYLHGLSLLNERGSFCFITSNSWLDVGYGADLQEFLLKHSHVKLVLDNEVKRSFAQADVNTVIVLLAPPDDRREHGLDRTARFVMLKRPFEEIARAEVFKEIEAVTERRSTEAYRATARPQRELLEEGLETDADDVGATPRGRPGQAQGPVPTRNTRGILIKTARYIGNKWGGKYLRAPDIFFTILEKGKGKLVRLGDIAEVRFGIKTGANEFFYLEPTGQPAPRGLMHVRNGA